MPQEMNILRCSSCTVYQVHIVKKAKKWQCKMCNFKQTFKQVYYKGSGKDCRLYVQKLNLTREYEDREQSKFQSIENKWEKYLDTSEDIESNTLFKASSTQSTSFQNSDDTICVDNEFEMYESSRKEHTNISNDSSYENNPEQILDDSDKEEYDVATSQKSVDDRHNDNSDFYSVTMNEIKDAKNIFDDNEDFDLAIDF